MSECPVECISVVIPCFNHGEYLQAAVQSAWDQDWPGLEVVIVDDGSTEPGTLRVLDTLREQGIRVLRQANRGPGSARNAGVAAARGELILLVDADDYFGASFAAKAVPVLRTEPNVGAVSCYVQKVGESAACKRYTGGCAADFVGFRCNAHSFALIRKSAWCDIGGYCEDPALGSEDWDFWLRFTACGWEVHMLPETLCYYRAKPGSRSSVYSDKPRAMKQLVERNRPIFQRYVMEAIIEREKIIADQKETIRAQRKQLRALQTQSTVSGRIVARALLTIAAGKKALRGK